MERVSSEWLQLRRQQLNLSYAEVAQRVHALRLKESRLKKNAQANSLTNTVWGVFQKPNASSEQTLHDIITVMDGVLVGHWLDLPDEHTGHLCALTHNSKYKQGKNQAVNDPLLKGVGLQFSGVFVNGTQSKFLKAYSAEQVIEVLDEEILKTWIESHQDIEVVGVILDTCNCLLVNCIRDVFGLESEIFNDENTEELVIQVGWSGEYSLPTHLQKWVFRFDCLGTKNTEVTAKKALGIFEDI